MGLLVIFRNKKCESFPQIVRITLKRIAHDDLKGRFNPYLATPFLPIADTQKRLFLGF
jgi:hypothetical protein